MLREKFDSGSRREDDLASGQDVPGMSGHDRATEAEW